MYRLSPFTYLAEGLLGAAIGNTQVECDDLEFARFTAPSGQTCGEYMSDYIAVAGGRLLDPTATDCQFCALDNTNQFLQSVSYSYDNRWRGTPLRCLYFLASF